MGPSQPGSGCHPASSFRWPRKPGSSCLSNCRCNTRHTWFSPSRGRVSAVSCPFATGQCLPPSSRSMAFVLGVPPQHGRDGDVGGVQCGGLATATPMGVAPKGGPGCPVPQWRGLAQRGRSDPRCTDHGRTVCRQSPTRGEALAVSTKLRPRPVRPRSLRNGAGDSLHATVCHRLVTAGGEYGAKWTKAVHPRHPRAPCPRARQPQTEEWIMDSLKLLEVTGPPSRPARVGAVSRATPAAAADSHQPTARGHHPDRRPRRHRQRGFADRSESSRSAPDRAGRVGTGGPGPAGPGRDR